MKEHKYIIMKNINKNEIPSYCLIDYYEDRIERYFNDLSSAKMYLEGLEEENDKSRNEKNRRTLDQDNEQL